MSDPVVDASTDVDLKVVGQIISAIGILHVFPSEIEIGNFLVPLLKEVSGCQSASLCLRKLSHPLGDVQGSCLHCAQKLNQRVDSGSYSCALVEQGNVRAHPLETVRGFYGYLILKVASESNYEKYAPFIRNLGNALALLLENRWQQDALQAANKNLEKQVAERTRELASVIESCGDPIAMLDTEYRYRFFNSAFHDEFQRVFGQALMPGDSMLQALAHLTGDLAAAEEYWGRALAGEDFTVTREFGDASLQRHWYEIHFSPVRDSDGKVVNAVHVVRNVTERKQLEEALEKKAAEMERFTYTVSHDLKSPLVTIKTFLGYLEKDLNDQKSERATKDLGFIHDAADKMVELLNELLRFARVGYNRNEMEQVPLQELVQAALSLVAGQIAESGVQVHVTQEPVWLTGDRLRLVEVFQNLIDNAVKFLGDQPNPRIEIGIDGAAGELVIFVQDNGKGIAPRHISKLFGLFEKLDPHTSGTGMGLALVRRIVEVHGGKILAESEGLGHGATFRFTLAKTQLRLPAR